MKQYLIKNQVKIGKISILIIFLALLRCLFEPFRLQALSNDPIHFGEVKAFLIAAIICTIGLLSMNLLLFYSRYRPIPFIAILVITGMVVVKVIYLL